MEKSIEAKSNILYVDDIATNLILFEAMFKEHFDVTTVLSGKEALEQMKQKKFACLISDQSMPGMTGTELMEVVRAKYPDMMRFILTAYSDYNTVVDSINNGEIYGFFNKPVDKDAVIESLNKAIEVYNLRIANKKMVEELERVNSELLQLDKTKTKYLNIITNEIRTPINKIISAIHMLKDRIASNDLNELLFYLDNAVSRLENFSFAASQLVKLNEESKAPIDMKEVSLLELIELCILDNKNRLDKLNTKIDIAFGDEDIRIKGEFTLLMTCLTTLVMNALEHIDKDGAIKIACYSLPEGNCIEIIDQGAYYSKNQIENLINFFAEPKKSMELTTGIELILAKQIMLSHGGRIVFKFIENKGASARMIFPLSGEM